MPQQVVTLLYGAGLRLQECLELRVKDIDFDRREVTIRRGKGQKDRRVMLPDGLQEPLDRHIAAVRAQHEANLYTHVLNRGGLGVKSPLDRL